MKRDGMLFFFTPAILMGRASTGWTSRTPFRSLPDGYGPEPQNALPPSLMVPIFVLQIVRSMPQGPMRFNRAACI